MLAINTQVNPSVMYYLNTAFEYEIRNHLDIEIRRLRSLEDPSDDDISMLERLAVVREYMDQRRAEFKL